MNYQELSDHTLEIIDKAMSQFRECVGQDILTPTIKTVPSLSFLPPKPTKNEPSTIDELMNEDSKNQILSVKNYLELSKITLTNLCHEREKTKTQYEKYYTTMLEEVEKAFKNNQKECIIKRGYQMVQPSNPIEISRLESFTMQVLSNDLTQRGYQVTYGPQYIHTPNDSDCRGCSDYAGWMQLSITF